MIEKRNSVSYKKKSSVVLKITGDGHQLDEVLRRGLHLMSKTQSLFLHMYLQDELSFSQLLELMSHSEFDRNFLLDKIHGMTLYERKCIFESLKQYELEVQVIFDYLKTVDVYEPNFCRVCKWKKCVQKISYLNKISTSTIDTVMNSLFVLDDGCQDLHIDFSPAAKMIETTDDIDLTDFSSLCLECLRKMKFLVMKPHDNKSFQTIPQDEIIRLRHIEQKKVTWLKKVTEQESRLRFQSLLYSTIKSVKTRYNIQMRKLLDELQETWLVKEKQKLLDSELKILVTLKNDSKVSDQRWNEFFQESLAHRVAMKYSYYDYLRESSVTSVTIHPTIQNLNNPNFENIQTLQSLFKRELKNEERKLFLINLNKIIERKTAYASWLKLVLEKEKIHQQNVATQARKVELSNIARCKERENIKCIRLHIKNCHIKICKEIERRNELSMSKEKKLREEEYSEAMKMHRAEEEQTKIDRFWGHFVYFRHLEEMAEKEKIRQQLQIITNNAMMIAVGEVPLEANKRIHDVATILGIEPTDINPSFITRNNIT